MCATSRSPRRIANCSKSTSTTAACGPPSGRRSASLPPPSTVQSAIRACERLRRRSRSGRRARPRLDAARNALSRWPLPENDSHSGLLSRNSSAAMLSTSAVTVAEPETPPRISRTVSSPGSNGADEASSVNATFSPTIVAGAQEPRVGEREREHVEAQRAAHRRTRARPSIAAGAEQRRAARSRSRAGPSIADPVELELPGLAPARRRRASGAQRSPPARCRGRPDRTDGLLRRHRPRGSVAASCCSRRKIRPRPTIRSLWKVLNGSRSSDSSTQAWSRSALQSNAGWRPRSRRRPAPRRPETRSERGSR